MKIISIITFIFLTFGAEIIADDFNEFYPKSSVETDDGENLILLGFTDNVRGPDDALVFDLKDYSYKLIDLHIRHRRSSWMTPITNSIAKIIGCSTDSNIVITNYLTGVKIQVFDIPNSYRNIEFSSDGKELYYTDVVNNILKIYNIESGELVDTKPLGLVSGKLKTASINSKLDRLALITADSLVVYSIKQDSVISKKKVDEDFGIFQFSRDGDYLLAYELNKVLLVNALTLDVIKEFDNNKKYSVQISNDMKYLYFHDWNGRLYSIVNVESSEQVISSYYGGRIFEPLYISPDEKIAIGYEETYYYCGRYLDMPYDIRLTYIYDWENKKRLRPVPNTYIMHPINAIFSDDNTKVAVVEGYYDSTLTAIVDINRELEKYIYKDGNPELFLENASLIAYEEEGQLNFYDIDTEELVKSLSVNLTGDVEFHYSNTNRMIVAFNSDSIKIYDYDNWTLDSEYSIDEVRLDSNVKWEGDFGLTSYSEGIISKFDLSGKTLETNTMKDIPEGFIFYDFSPNGRYVLGMTDKFTVVLHDYLFEINKEVNLEGKSFNQHSEIEYLKLDGNLPVLLLAFQDHPIQPFEVYRTYDFDFEEWGGGAYFPSRVFYNSDFKYKYAVICPSGTELTELRDPVSSISTKQIPENAIYPNPSSSYIHLDKLGVHSFSNFRIYNSFGKLVMNVGNIISTVKVDVDDLPTGVYFLQSNEIQASFVKE